MTPSAPASDLLTTKGVHVVGDFTGRTALTQGAHDLVAAIERIGYPVQILDLPLASGRLQPSDYHYESPRSPLTIIHWNGDRYSGLVRDLPAELFENRRIVGVWYWETENELPESHRKGYDLLDEVWVTSQFVADSLSPAAPVPLKKFPPLITPLQLPAPDQWQLPAGLDHDRFVFLFSFDYRSISRRKNPEGVCEAFVRAFPQPSADGPLCVIKSIAGESDHPLECMELRSRYRFRPDILFIDGWMPVEQRDSLMARANCYVSLHRSEGLGLTLMESMSLGKPCIGTNYSGNLEFMTPENSWLVPFQPTVIGPGAWPYPPHHTWAEPDLDAAAAAFREVHDHPDRAKEKGLKGQASILEHHSLDAVSRRIQQLLEESIVLPPRVKPALQAQESPAASQAAADGSIRHTTGRTRAYQLIKQCRELEKLAQSQRKAIRKRHLSPEASELLGTFQEIFKLQQQIQKEVLGELGELKQRLKNYHGATLDALVRDQQLTTRMLGHLVRSLNDGDSRPPQ